MKQCPQCKNTYDDASFFCEECGTRLTAIQTDVLRQSTDAVQTVYAGARQDSGRQAPEHQRTNDVPPADGTQKPYAPYSRRTANPARAGRREIPQRKKAGIRISRKVWIALGELMLLIALIAAFCVVGNQKTSPADAAQTYFEAMVQGDFATIAAQTDLPESPFLTEEAFRKACETWTPLAYKGTLTKVSASILDRGDAYGSEIGTNGLSDYVKTVQIAYMLSGDANVYTYDLQLISGEDTTMFFFHPWEVVECTPFLAKNVSIVVPRGASLVVDGYLVDDRFCESTEYDGDIYKLDLFAGTHSLTLLADGFDAVTKDDIVFEDDAFYTFPGDAISVSESVQNALEKQAKTLLEQIYTAAMQEEDVATALAGFGSSAAAKMAEEYNNLLNELHGDSDVTITKITLDDFTPYQCTPLVDNGELYAYLDLEFSGTMNYVDHSGKEKQNGSSERYLGFGAYYQYVEDTWMPIEYGYFYG